MATGEGEGEEEEGEETRRRGTHSWLVVDPGSDKYCRFSTYSPLRCDGVWVLDGAGRSWRE